MLGRRDFLKLTGMGTLGLMIPDNLLISQDYNNFSHKSIKWQQASKGLYFSKTEVYKGKELVETIATLKINPNLNKIKVFNGYNKVNMNVNNLEEWRKKTGSLAMINGNQYMDYPAFYPCDLVISDGKQEGPKKNKYSKGILVAEPKDLEGKLKKADIIDFDYDSFDYKTTQYTQCVQHWPILLDREGRIKTKETDWQANRTVVAKTKENEMLFMTTEGGYFTLYNFGKFLKESNERADKGFNVHTAMNMDGGISTGMTINTKAVNYNNGRRISIPVVIGIFKRS